MQGRAATAILRAHGDLRGTVASETGKVLVVDQTGDAQNGTPDTEGDLRTLPRH